MLPKLSHLQFLVIECLGTAELSGKELRQELRRKGLYKSLTTFYQLMARLEKAKFVEGEQGPVRMIGGVAQRERSYRVVAAGSAAARETLFFYKSRTLPF